MAIARPLLIFLLTLMAYTYFCQQDPYNPQQFTRLALGLSLADGRVDIDRYAPYTIDVSRNNGHFYADKAPGLSFLAVPAIVVTRAALVAAGQETDVLKGDTLPIYLRAATWGTVTWIAALGVVAVYGAARKLGARDDSATFAAFTLALATPFFGWATTFFAHSVAGALLAVALWMALALRHREIAGIPELALGALLGFALVVELTVAPAVVLIGLLALLGGPVRPLRWIVLSLGGFVGLLPLLIYNAAAFGSPFSLGYAHVVGFEGMRQGLFGIGLPDPTIANALLLGLHRGLIPLSPILLLVPVGLVAMWKAGTPGPAVTIIGAAVSALAINAGYHYWNGGYAIGPRHLVAALPLLSVALAFYAPRSTLDKAVAGCLITLSLCFSVMPAEVSMFAPHEFAAPLWEFVLPRFVQKEEVLRAIPIVICWVGFVLLMSRGHGPLMAQSTEAHR